MYELVDFFCGAGGSSQGAHAVPGVSIRLAANHWQLAIESHEANFPEAEHFKGDLHDAKLEQFPGCDIFWASPECTKWSQARGKKKDFAQQPDLFGETLPDEATDRSRALMYDVPKYLEAMKLRGRAPLAGVVENVTDERDWIEWRNWVRSIENLGYRTRLIAFNSMHARPVLMPMAPQSRDRLYLAYWSVTLGRDPDWDKWLRPPAWCWSCESVISAVLVWKRPGNDMGRYKAQYLYRCPKVSCRGQIVDPDVLPAAAAIDWSMLGERIGDRPKPLSPKTMARIEAGLRKYAVPISLEAAGNTYESGNYIRAWPVTDVLTTQTASDTKALACEPMMIPAGGTWNDEAHPVSDPMRTRTTRETDGVAVPPFLTPLRSGRNRSSGIDEPTATVVADGSNHALCVPPFLTILRGMSVTSRTDDPMSTVTGMGAHHGLVVPQPFLTVHRGDADEARTCGMDRAMPTQTASGNTLGLAIPLPMTVPVEGRDGKMAIPVTDPHRTQTGRAETGLAVPPTALVMRNNTARKGDGAEMCTPVDEPVRTITTKGHQSLLDWRHVIQNLMVPYYGTGVASSAAEPVGTLTTKDRYALASPAGIDINDVLFRMLEPHEIGAAMAFRPDYVVLGTSKRVRVRQYGNAVTPPVAEILISALVEAISGEELECAA